jgi:hypothetical protein
MISEVKVRVEDILPIVHENREMHREIFLKAVDGYKKKWIELLEVRLKDLRAGKKVYRAISLTEPQDHTEDYDRAITMLELCVDDEIVLHQAEFACIVMDDWGWKDQFTSTASLYGAM